MKYRDIREAATGNLISVYATQLHQETKYQHAMQWNFCFANIKETYLRAKGSQIHSVQCQKSIFTRFQASVYVCI
jgi:hypothetical protein